MKSFSLPLLAWYKANKRSLPFRDTHNAYLIWLSEIIFQQTRISQGLSYYEKFAQKFPTPAALAAADEDGTISMTMRLTE